MRFFQLPAVALCAAGLIFVSAAPPARAQGSTQAKVAVVNFQNAVLSTAEIQKAVISRHLINEWKPALPAKFYGPDPGPESTELALA